jgi:hypothetical protein
MDFFLLQTICPKDGLALQTLVSFVDVTWYGGIGVA